MMGPATSLLMVALVIGGAVLVFVAPFVMLWEWWRNPVGAELAPIIAIPWLLAECAAVIDMLIGAM